MSVQEIEVAAKQLSPNELDELIRRLSTITHDEWDRQIERDLNAGKFDALFEELDQEYKQGLTKPL